MPRNRVVRNVPSITAIADQATNEGLATGAITFTVSSSDVAGFVAERVGDEFQYGVRLQR